MFFDCSSVYANHAVTDMACPHLEIACEMCDGRERPRIQPADQYPAFYVLLMVSSRCCGERVPLQRNLPATLSGLASTCDTPQLLTAPIVVTLRTTGCQFAGKAVPLSFDHKPTNHEEKNRIERAGGTISDAGGVPRVNGNLNLSRAIGDLRYKDNTSLPPEAQIITAHPDVRVFELTPADDFFMLACDGIWDVLSNEVRILTAASIEYVQGTWPS